MANWAWDIITSVISGVATTASAALLLSGMYVVRNWMLKSKISKMIRKECKPSGFSQMDSNGLSTFIYSGIEINNTLTIPFIIRSVWAGSKTEGGQCETPLHYRGLNFRDDMSPCLPGEEVGTYGCVTLRPFTNGLWVMYAKNIIPPQRQERINKIYVHAEFLTFFKTPKVIEVEVDKSSIIERINEMIDHVNENKGSYGNG